MRAVHGARVTCNLPAYDVTSKRAEGRRREREARASALELARWHSELVAISARTLEQGSASASSQPPGDAGGRSTDRKICDTNTLSSLPPIAAAFSRSADLLAGDVEPADDGERWLDSIARRMPSTVRERIAWRWSRRVGELARCGRARWLRMKDGRPESWRPMRCRDRLCEHCWAAASAMRERDVVAMAETARELGFRLAFATLTMRCRRGDPRVDVSLALEAWRMVRQRSRRDGTIAGGWRRLEVTWKRPKRRGKREVWRAHAHIHAVCLVPLDVRVHDVRESLVDRWRQACADLGRVAYDASQDVDFADNEEATRRYLMKYLQKPADVCTHPSIAGLASIALRGRQLIAPFGAAHAGALRAALPSELAEGMACTRYERRDERARWTSAKLGDLWRDGAAFSRLEACGPIPAPPRELVALCAPDVGAPWHARQVAERGDVEQQLTLRLTPAALRWLLEAGVDDALDWSSALEDLNAERQQQGTSNGSSNPSELAGVGSA